jgi:hypothetical protein
VNLNDVAKSHMTRYRTDTGQAFFGEITKLTRSQPPDNFDSPRLIVRVGVNCAVNAGTIMKTMLGRYYLLGLNDDEETGRLQTKSFRLFEVPNTLTWKRKSTVVDAVTNLEKGTTDLDLGTIRCALEKPTTIREEGIGVREETWRLITNQDVRINDVIDGNKRVRSVFQQLGVAFAELE